MKKHIHFIFVFILMFFFSSSKLSASNIQNLTLYFDKDKYTVSETEKQKLATVTDADLVYIDGYTDSDGSYEYNQKLSQNRAQEIKRLIVSANPGIRTDVHFFGKTKLKKQELNEEDKKQNRRVEIAFIKNPFLQLKTEVQKFRVDNSKDQIITCKEGTVIEIPQGAFNNKMVDIEISEHYKLENILGENLTTTSNDEALETAGMIKINAMVNGIEVQPVSELTYKFPNKNNKDDFKLFLGERDNEYNINWVLDKKEEVEQQYVISGSSVATQDIALQSEQFWNNIQDKLRFYETTSPEFLCFYNANVGLSINPNGLLDTIVTNYPLNSNCDKVMKRITVQNLPKQFTAKENYLYSTIEMNFNDFLPKDIALKNQQLLTKAKKTIDINTYAATKTTIMQNAIAERNRIEREKEYAKQQAEYDKYAKELQEKNEKEQSDYLAKLEKSDKDFAVNQNAISQYVFTSKNLGWLNCDQFLNDNVWSANNLIDFVVKSNIQPTIIVLMKKYKSIFYNEFSYNNSVIKKIPNNQEIIVVSSYKKDNQLYLAIKETNTNSKECSDLHYKPVSIQQFKQAIKDIKI